MQKKKRITNNKEKRNDKFIKQIFLKIKNKFLNSFIFIKDGNNTYSFKEVIIIMIFSLGFGFLTCISYVNIFSNGRNYKTILKDLDKIIDTYYTIKENYYGELDTEKLVDSAVNGMVSSIDDTYTSYSDSQTTELFMEKIEGIYEGIGCTVGNSLNGNIIVVDVFEDTPADKAGILVNDIIIKIDDEDFTDKTSNDMATYVKNSTNSSIILTILRNDEEKKLTVNREEIEIPYVTSEIIKEGNKKIGYICISLFSMTSNKQFKNELEKIEEEGIDSLIIDVRGNSGGYLSSVTSIINMFLKKGTIMYQLEDSEGTIQKKDTTKEKRTYPVAVLINESSASASEILASAIKESYKGYVVGVNSFGKGTVQQTTNLPDGSMIKYTTQNWKTPDGNWINEVGVTPTNIVELNSKYYEEPKKENDNQLNAAIELLTK